MVRLSELATSYTKYCSLYLNSYISNIKPVANTNNTCFTGTTEINTLYNAFDHTSHIFFFSEKPIDLELVMIWLI